MRARLRRPLLTVVACAVFVAGGASAGYTALGWERVSPAAVGIEIADLLSADSAAVGDQWHPGVHDVYAAQESAPVWFLASDRGAALRTLGHADRDGLPMDARMEALSAHADTASTVESLAALDLALTDALLRFGDALSRPRADAAELYGINWTPVAPVSGDARAELTAALSAHKTVGDALDAWANVLRPQHPGYHRLRAALARELDLDALPPLDRDLAVGDSGDAVVALHARLAADGADLAGRVYNNATASAVRDAQRGLDLSATGRLDGATRSALNVRRPELIPLLQTNLEKWRWLPRDLGDLHIWVNVPRYELALRERADDGWSEAIRFRSVVGAADWQTPSFTDTLESIVFNPTWTVPASIQRESYGRVRGRVVRPPGPGNAMGRVKFLFPNKHAVYVHDTPTKWAFDVDDRARSHGCVRAGDPEGLARELLTRTNDWEASRVADIFSGSWRRTQHVRVETTVPVHLVYFTAEVDPDGRLRIWDDVYDRDQKLADAMGLDLPEMTSELVSSLIADRIGNEAQVADAEAQDTLDDDTVGDGETVSDDTTEDAISTPDAVGDATSKLPSVGLDTDAVGAALDSVRPDLGPATDSSATDGVLSVADPRSSDL